MDNTMRAKPKYSRTDGVWNIEVEVEGKWYPLGQSIGDSILFKHCKWDTKADAVKYIEEKDRLVLYVKE